MSVSFSFKLSPNFVEEYKTKEPKWGWTDAAGNSIGELTFVRTYSRVKEDGTKEKWWEVCERVINGMYSLQKDYCIENRLEWNHHKAQSSAQEAYKRLFEFKWTPPGRGLAQMGTPLVMNQKNAASLLNCAYTSTGDMKGFDPGYPFAWTTEALMLGIGVGFDTLGAGKFTVLKPGKNTVKYTIPDTREGWAISVGMLVNSYLKQNKNEIEFDYSELRPYGAPIKTFGGTASGPDPLRDGHEQIRGVLNANIGKPLTAKTIVDIQNIIGTFVVAGNARRCLPEGTRVNTLAGVKKIEDVTDRDYVVTVAGKSKVLNNFDQGKQDTVFINHRFGRFECTPNHRVAVYESPTSYTFVRADELKAGDRMVFDRSAHLQVDNVAQLPQSQGRELIVEGDYTRSVGRENSERYEDIPCSVDGCTRGSTVKTPESMCNAHYLRNKKYGDPTIISGYRKEISIPELDTEMAWLVGLLHGDGYFGVSKDERSGKVSISCSIEYPEIIERAKSQMERFGVDVKVEDFDNYVNVSTYSLLFAKWGQEHIKAPNETIRVPDFIWESNTEIRSAYLAGLHDADGSTKGRGSCIVATVYPEFAEDIRSLLASVGIPSSIRTTDRSHHSNWKDISYVYLAGVEACETANNQIGHFSAGKYSDIKIARSTHSATFPKDWVGHYHSDRVPAAKAGYDVDSHMPVEVMSVTDGRMDIQTYDIEVEDIHQFTAEGFVVHNSAELALGLPTDEGFIDLKNHKVYPDRPWAYMSNNSISADVGMDYGPYVKNTSENGEPGYVWLDVAREYGRLIDPPDNKDHRVKGFNPCFHPDTLVETVNGPIPISKINEPMKVYTRDHNGKLAIRQASAAFQTKKQAETLKIGLQNGDELIVTPDHKIMKKGGTWVEAKDLVVNDSLEVLCRTRRGWRYSGVRLNSQDPSEQVMEHRLIWEGVNGPIPEGFDIDHINGMHHDNRIENLRALEHGEHALHSISQRENNHQVLDENGKFTFSGVNGKKSLSRKIDPPRATNWKNQFTVSYIEEGPVVDVWDITVEDTHNLIANGVVAHNCVEQPLESYEMCCLVEVHLNRAESLEDFEQTLKFAYLYGKTVTLLTSPWERTNAVMLRNRRIGLSTTGIAGFVENHSLAEYRKWADAGYRYVSELDVEYSEWLGIRESIRKTTVKPSGSVSLLSGATPGVHWSPGGKYFKRAIRFGEHDDTWRLLRDAGYKVEKDVYSANTRVVYFPLESDAGRAESEVSIYEKIHLAAEAQKFWSDNGVSVTVSFNAETEADDVEKVLRMYEGQLKAVSFLPMGNAVYEQQPYTSLTEKEFLKESAKIRRIDTNELYGHGEDAAGEAYCTTDVCEIKPAT